MFINRESQWLLNCGICVCDFKNYRKCTIMGPDTELVLDKYKNCLLSHPPFVFLFPPYGLKILESKPHIQEHVGFIEKKQGPIGYLEAERIDTRNRECSVLKLA